MLDMHMLLHMSQLPYSYIGAGRLVLANQRGDCRDVVIREEEGLEFFLG